jgi:methylated-DNA-[protein]-cysteine S-methyltransferase
MLKLLEEKIATPLGPLWVICDEQFRLRAVWLSSEPENV